MSTELKDIHDSHGAHSEASMLSAEPRLTGLLGEFDDVSSVVTAAQKTRAAGYKVWDVHSPFPIHGIDAVIGAWCTIGHSAIIHACTIGEECLIGMGATVLDGANIGARSIVGANALVPQRFTCPPGSMVYGSPAKVVRPLTEAEQRGLRPWAEKYIEVAKAHAALARSTQPPFAIAK